MMSIRPLRTSSTCRSFMHIFEKISPSTSKFYCTRKDENPEEQTKQTTKTKSPIDNHYYKWRKPWMEHDGYVASKLELFVPSSSGQSMNFLKIMQQKYDFSPKGFANWFAKVKLSRDLYKQRYIPERHKFLGPNLATAHFVVFRGGAVRFQNGTKWIKEDEDGNSDLPTTFVKDLHLDALDASNINFMYEALENFVFLDKLRWASFANNEWVDDWFLDKISGEFKALEYLNISGCPKVTHKGISILVRFENLKVLNLQNVLLTAESKLACLSMQELKPHLKIHGVDYDTAKDTEDRSVA
ncbi:distal membrane-arm assembly complex protein 2 [Neocloeon triangulifer]|uniref:distal membrane-arm assembly complex protein 2 n=1 Tax=Neocloeon triangulifer TaxID=2078957 RepID=UPI00286ED14F|nr:distal membrane-arm assembly complex protein 2 [Neocloeon triangulifer]